VGHEDQFPPTRLSAGCGFRKETIAGMRRNGRDGADSGRSSSNIATLDVISGGRFELGAGLGFKREEFEGFGAPFKERGVRTNQSLELIRRALVGETVTFKSELFDFQKAR
jgi:hypothetical protein